MTPNHHLRGPLQWAALFVVFAVVHWTARFQPYWWDSLGYVFAQAVEIHDAGLFPILRRWDVGHPTGYFFLLAVIMKIFGVGPLAGHLLSWGYAGLLAWSTHALGRSLGAGRAAAAVCAVAVMTFPLVFASSRQITADLALTALCFAAMWCWAARRWRLYAVFGSLAVLTKFTGFLLVPALATAALIDHPRTEGNRRRELLCSLAPLAALLVFFAVRWAVRGPGWTIGWNPIQELAPFWRPEAFRENWSDATRQLWQLARVTWPATVMLAALTLAGIRARGRIGRPPRALLAVALFGLLWAAAHMQMTALLPRFGTPLVVISFLILVWAIRRLPGGDVTAVAVCSVFVLLNIALLRPEWNDRLPVSLANTLRPVETVHGHNLEIDLRYEDGIELICWTATVVQRDATERGETEVPGVATQWPITTALQDRRLGYEEEAFAVRTMMFWEKATPESHPYVVTIEGMTRLPAETDACPWPVTSLGIRSIGGLTARVWRIEGGP